MTTGAVIHQFQGIQVPPKLIEWINLTSTINIKYDRELNEAASAIAHPADESSDGHGFKTTVVHFSLKNQIFNILRENHS
jgi:hypothetical protein